MDRHVSGPDGGLHCVEVIGYSEAEQCWICKNSWGAGWGEGGFFRIAYGQCAIDSGALGVEGVQTPDSA